MKEIDALSQRLYVVVMKTPWHPGLLCIQGLCMFAIAGTSMFALPASAKLDCNSVSSFPNLIVGFEAPTTTPEVFNKQKTDLKAALTQFYQALSQDQELAQKDSSISSHWQFPIDFFGAVKLSAEKLATLKGVTIAGFEASEFIRSGSTTDEELLQIYKDRGVAIKEWRMPQAFFYGKVIDIQRTSGGTLILTIERPDETIQKIIPSFGKGYIHEVDGLKNVESQTFRIYGPKRETTDILKEVMDDVELLKRIGPENRPVAAKIAELYATLPSSYATSAIIKILKGKAKQYTTHPFYGVLAGDKNYPDAKLRPIGELIENFLTLMRIRSDASAGSDRYDYWIPETVTQKQKALLLPKLIDPNHQMSTELPKRELPPKPPAPKPLSKVELARIALAEAEAEEARNKLNKKNKTLEKPETRAGGRYFTDKLKPAELEQKIFAAFMKYKLAKGDAAAIGSVADIAALGDGILHTLTSKITSDLSKTKLDKAEEITGIHTLENGFTYLGVKSGGSVNPANFYIIYWDGASLRGYLPSKGNPWNGQSAQIEPEMIKSDIQARIQHKW